MKGTINEAINMINRRSGHEKMLNDLSNYIENLIKENSGLKEKLKTWNKDEEIQKLENEKLELIKNSLCIMSNKEKAEASGFQEQHYNSCKSNISYTLAGTGLGMCIKVKCNKCNEEKDITDTSNW